MMTILELKTGLFPDAETVTKALSAREGRDQVSRLDVSNLKPDDTKSWNAAAAAILNADLVVTV